MAEAADHRAAADARELVHARAAARHHAVADLGVAAEEGRVGEHAVAADLHIVAGVAARHPEVPVSDAGRPVLAGRAVDGDVLAERVAVADHRAIGESLFA